MRKSKTSFERFPTTRQLSDRISHYVIIIVSMGQANCMNICGERGDLETIHLESLMNSNSDEPTPMFAKKVRQHIELNPKIKETYLMYRNC